MRVSLCVARPLQPAPLRRKPSGAGFSLQEAAPSDPVIPCDYQRPCKDSVDTLGWTLGKDMGNSEPHLRCMMEYNWADAKAAAQAAVAAAHHGEAVLMPLDAYDTPCEWKGLSELRSPPPDQPWQASLPAPWTNRAPQVRPFGV